MEVVVTEEKKKIFRARKTMKMSDRLQLESLHSTLLTTAPSLSSPSPPPLMNGTHKEDAAKVTEKEQINTPDSVSSNVPSPDSPTSASSPMPFLSLNLSPSSTSSHGNKEQDGPASPCSPFQSEFCDTDKTENEENGTSSSPSRDSSLLLNSMESKDQQKNTKSSLSSEDKNQENQDAKEQSSVDADTKKDSVSSAPSSVGVSEFTQPMEEDSDSTANAFPDTLASKSKDKNSQTSKVAPSNSKSNLPSHVKVKDEKDDKTKVKKDVDCDEKMEVDSVKKEPKKEKDTFGQDSKSTRPSSTPPSDTAQETSSSNLKRTLSEGNDLDMQGVKKEVKRPKVEHELEAQLELKITSKAGNHHKLEKIVQQLVEERLKILELTVFDKHFQELKDRVDKIDCANKHQTALNSLQSKISRLAKKFGEANQASENKRKQEALAAAAAAATAASAASAIATAAATPNAPTTTTTISAVKPATITLPQVQRVLRRQTVEPQPVVPREGTAPSLGKTPALSVDAEGEEEDMGYKKERDVSQQLPLAAKLALFNEGRCRGNVKLRRISPYLESVLYNNSKRASGSPRADRYASYLFRHLVPYNIYSDWVAKVNYNGLLGKEALPTNLRKAIKMHVDRRFPVLSDDRWREIRDIINDILRVKRKPNFFRDYGVRTSTLI